MIDQFIGALLASFIPLFIILDPFLSLAAFISITKGMSTGDKAKQALIAAGVAFGLLIVFLFIGTFLLTALSIKIFSLQVGGGVILLILGVQAVLGLEFAKKNKDYKMAAVVIGTPLLCGPGSLTTIILQSQQFGYVIPFIASAAACIITYVMLVFSDKIAKVCGERGIEIVSRVLGVMLTAIAVQMMYNGIIGMIANYATIIH
jgi:multiple antibiotic resistance protein